MKLIVFTIIFFSALLGITSGLFVAGGCTSNTGGGATTQPAFDAGSLVTLAITDYEALVASGVIKETPELDAAITAVFAA